MLAHIVSCNVRQRRLQMPLGRFPQDSFTLIARDRLPQRVHAPCAAEIEPIEMDAIREKLVTAGVVASAEDVGRCKATVEVAA